MNTHTWRETRIGYVVRKLPTFAGLSLDVRCFPIYQLGLSEIRLPLSHNRLLLTIPYTSRLISAQSLHLKWSKCIAHNKVSCSTYSFPFSKDNSSKILPFCVFN